VAVQDRHMVAVRVERNLDLLLNAGAVLGVLREA